MSKVKQQKEKNTKTVFVMNDDNKDGLPLSSQEKQKEKKSKPFLQSKFFNTFLFLTIGKSYKKLSFDEKIYRIFLYIIFLVTILACLSFIGIQLGSYFSNGGFYTLVGSIVIAAVIAILLISYSFNVLFGFFQFFVFFFLLASFLCIFVFHFFLTDGLGVFCRSPIFIVPVFVLFSCSFSHYYLSFFWIVVSIIFLLSCFTFDSLTFDVHRIYEHYSIGSPTFAILTYYVFVLTDVAVSVISGLHQRYQNQSISNLIDQVESSILRLDFSSAFVTRLLQKNPFFLSKIEKLMVGVLKNSILYSKYLPDSIKNKRFEEKSNLKKSHASSESEKRKNTKLKEGKEEIKTGNFDEMDEDDEDDELDSKSSNSTLESSNLREDETSFRIDSDIKERIVDFSVRSKKSCVVLSIRLDEKILKDIYSNNCYKINEILGDVIDEISIACQKHRGMIHLIQPGLIESSFNCDINAENPSLYACDSASQILNSPKIIDLIQKNQIVMSIVVRKYEKLNFSNVNTKISNRINFFVYIPDNSITDEFHRSNFKISQNLHNSFLADPEIVNDVHFVYSDSRQIDLIEENDINFFSSFKKEKEFSLGVFQIAKVNEEKRSKIDKSEWYESLSEKVFINEEDRKMSIENILSQCWSFYSSGNLDSSLSLTQKALSIFRDNPILQNILFKIKRKQSLSIQIM